jgi:hypothetical protein
LRGTRPSGPYRRAGLGHRVTLKRLLRCPCYAPAPSCQLRDRCHGRRTRIGTSIATHARMRASPAAKNIRCFCRQSERSALFLHRSMWDIAVVKFWPLLPRLLSILAVVSLLIVPMAAPSVAMAAAPAGAMEDMASMADGMPCPHKKPAVPDCPKSCPLAALCMTGCLPYALVSGASIPARFAVADVKSPGDDVEAERLTEPPPPRPPRT